LSSEPIDRTIFEVMALMAAAKCENGFDKLDEDSQRLLFFLGTRIAAGKKVNVKDLTGRESFGSHPTVQRRLRHLAKAGWLAMRQDPEDGRALNLELTAFSIESFNRMSSILQRFSPIVILNNHGR
jgi:DNA-binding MarR family transcriptional regulator